jgi:hypothetical protein
MKKILYDLMNGKWAIRYTIKVMTNMIPREVEWLANLPLIGQITRVGQLFWYLNKVIFFAFIVSWFKPQYEHIGAKIALLVITISIFFVAWWFLKKDVESRKRFGDKML